MSADGRSVSILGVTGSVGQSTLAGDRRTARAGARHPCRSRHRRAATSPGSPTPAAASNRASPLSPTLACSTQAREALRRPRRRGRRRAARAGGSGGASRPIGSCPPSSARPGLPPTMAAVRRGALVALANKECLVCAGPLFIEAAKAHGATLLPVDSEHNAIFQVLTHPERVERLTLTASGGPFRTWSREQMAAATPEQACAHPNWSMGRKISVDSATLMNKGLELIEASYLFRFPPRTDRGARSIPKASIHSLVHYVDGSVLAQLAAPDMRTPIAYALAWPDRAAVSTARLDLAGPGASSPSRRPDVGALSGPGACAGRPEAGRRRHRGAFGGERNRRGSVSGGPDRLPRHLPAWSRRRWRSGGELKQGLSQKRLHPSLRWLRWIRRRGARPAGLREVGGSLKAGRRPRKYGAGRKRSNAGCAPEHPDLRWRRSSSSSASWCSFTSSATSKSRAGARSRSTPSPSVSARRCSAGATARACSGKSARCRSAAT